MSSDIAGYWLTIKRADGAQVFGVSHFEVEREPSRSGTFGRKFVLPDGTTIEVRHYRTPSGFRVFAAECAARARGVFARFRAAPVWKPPA